MLTLVGKTIDDRPVVGGVFNFTATTGLPIEDALKRLRELGLVVSWMHYAEEAALHGVRSEAVLARISNAIQEEYGLSVIWQARGSVIWQAKDS